MAEYGELQKALAADDKRAALEAMRDILTEAIENARPSRRDLAATMKQLDEVLAALNELRESEGGSILDNARLARQERMKARLAQQGGNNGPAEQPPTTDSPSDE